MVSSNDFKNGMTILYDGKIYKIMEFMHVKPGKGSAFVRTKLRDIRSGAVIDYTFNSSEKVELADIENPNILIDNRAAYQNYAVWVPIRNEDGSYAKKLTLIPEHADVSAGYLPLTEKNIAKAFEEAKEQKKILLFDEVDSFFRERSYASQSWEITLVNEFLTQMEKFEGIVICTTNLRNIMDKAMQRRFHIMVEFKALKDEGVESLLGKYFPQFDFNEEDIRRISRYQSATPGDFGNLSSRLRFMNQEKVTETYITDELCKMQEEKELGKRSIGFRD